MMKAKIILEHLKKIDKSELLYIFGKLLEFEKISFSELSQKHIEYLKSLKEKETKEVQTLTSDIIKIFISKSDTVGEPIIESVERLMKEGRVSITQKDIDKSDWAKKTLILPLKKKWFNMWKSGKKNEEYRELKPYWAKRLCANYKPEECCRVKDKNQVGCCGWCNYFEMKKYDNVRLTLGYPKSNDNEKIIELSNPEIYIFNGKPELGAEPNKEYFVIKGRKEK